MKFETSQKINKWIKEHQKKCKSYASGGEQFMYTFIPNGIIECQTVQCMCCKEKFTDYTD